jgi:DNA-binding PucR family transcriptional regulator
MDVTANLDVTGSPEAIRVWIDDLDRFPKWLSIVPRSEREVGNADNADSIGGAAWAVELRAKVGPLARSKKLRMVRTVDDPMHVRFERAELDGRQHSPWVLDATLEPIGELTRLTMTLHYGGTFGGGLVERLLGDEINSSKEKLRQLVEEGTTAP